MVESVNQNYTRQDVNQGGIGNQSYTDIYFIFSISWIEIIDSTNKTIKSCDKRCLLHKLQTLQKSLLISSKKQGFFSWRNLLKVKIFMKSWVFLNVSYNIWLVLKLIKVKYE